MAECENSVPESQAIERIDTPRPLAGPMSGPLLTALIMSLWAVAAVWTASALLPLV